MLSPKLRALTKRGMIRALASSPLTSPVRTLTAGRLRTVTYHRFRSAGVLTAHVRHMADLYRPVDIDAVLAAVEHGRGLPPRSIWITFDDGDTSVVESAGPLLRDAGISATLFVCPGLIELQQPYWWDVIERAEVAGFQPDPNGALGRLTTRLKAVPDHQRRKVVQEAVAFLGRAGIASPPAALRLEDLYRWRGMGHHIGSHSWDHPILPRCSEADQVSQVSLAQEWLDHHVPDARPVFAYPNGDYDATTESTLRDHGYKLGMLFDQRLTNVRGAPLRMSRLRLNAEASAPEVRARLSGTWAIMQRSLGR